MGRTAYPVVLLEGESVDRHFHYWSELLKLGLVESALGLSTLDI